MKVFIGNDKLYSGNIIHIIEVSNLKWFYSHLVNTAKAKVQILKFVTKISQSKNINFDFNRYLI